MDGLFPKSEQRRMYIKSKTIRLQKKMIITRIIYALFIIIILILSFKYISNNEAFILFLIASVWATLTRHLCNLHIDILTALKLDMDRDLQLGLEGFETSD